METVEPDVPSTVPGSVMSLPARLLNVYATPSDVFESIKGAELCVWNWLLPVLLSCVVGIVYALVVFAQPNVQQQIREKQDEQLQKLVDSGKLTAADVDAQRARMDQIGLTVVKVAGGTGAVLVSFGAVFVLAAVLKVLASLMLKRSIEYMKLVEVAGLAGMIGLLGTIVQMLLVVMMGSVYVSVGPVLLISEFDPQNRWHLLLLSVNLMTFWYLAVLGIGLGKLAEASFWKATWPLVALWVLLRLGITWAGWGLKGI